jgi:hypothetical protein
VGSLSCCRAVLNSARKSDGVGIKKPRSGVRNGVSSQTFNNAGLRIVPESSGSRRARSSRSARSTRSPEWRAWNAWHFDRQQMPDPAPPRKARICGGRPW